MTQWEYRIVALPGFDAPSASPNPSPAVLTLNDEGSQGWEGIGMTLLGDGGVAVLLKRPRGGGPQAVDEDP